MSAANRPFDIVIWGATGFTGRLAAEYLVSTYGFTDESKIKYAFAGRSLKTLEQVRGGLARSTEQLAALQLLTGDIRDEQSIEAITKQCRVLVAMAGPYALCGEPLIKACINTRTDYVDITGEILWVRKMRETYHQAATDAGVKIVCCCGFDYVPNDLMMFQLGELARKSCGSSEFTNVHQVIDTNTPSFSGGTARSVVQMLKSHSLKTLTDPYNMLDTTLRGRLVEKTGNPDTLVRRNNDKRVAFKSSMLGGEIIAPSFMSGGMRRFVLWSNAVQDFKYGANLVYHAGDSSANYFAGFIKGAVLIFMTLVLLVVSRFRVVEFLMAPVGEGPLLEGTRKYRVNARIAGEVAQKGGHIVRCTWKFPEGEAYVFTAMSAIECAVSLAQEREALNKNFGVIPPSAALGKHLINRLTAQGVEISEES